MPDIIEYLTGFDFVMIQETWCETKQQLNELCDKLHGYKCESECATRVSKFGRPSGGLAVYFKEKFSKCVNRVDAGFKFGIILEVQKLVTTLSAENVNMLLVCSYLPPEGSNTYDTENKNGVTILKEKLVDLKTRYPNHKLLVAGDLNARIGCSQDYIDDNVHHMPGMEWYEPDQFDVPRQAKDVVENNFGRSLVEICIELGIHVLNGRANGDNPGQYTNITEHGFSTVDYFILESELYEYVDTFEVAELAETNHMPMLCTLNMYINTGVPGNNVLQNAQYVNMPQQCKYRWKTDHREQFIETVGDEVSNGEFAKMSNMLNDDIEEAIEVFEGILCRAAEPMKIKNNTKRKKHVQPKWWNNDCNTLKEFKYRALKKARVTDKTEDFQTYRESIKDFKNYCKTRKSQWQDELKEKLIASKSNPTNFWNTLKSINKKYIEPPNVSPQEWFEYFENLLNQEVKISEEFAEFVHTYTEKHDIECDICNGINQGENAQGELNMQISYEEIVHCVKQMSNGKSGGIDGIIIEMLKSSLHVTGPYLLHLFNSILNSGKYPEKWTKAILVPLHKKGPVSDLNNYRGIALLSVLGKIFSKIVNARLVHWAETHGVEKEEQAGFRKGYSTVDNIFILQSIVQKYCSKKGGRFYALYVDFSKAFDTIPHGLLFYQLISKGVHGKILKVLRSMYSSLQSCVRTPHGLTEFFKCERGTRQGCMLSPFFFSLYVGELVTMFEEEECKGIFVSESAPNIACLLFADDLVACADTVGRLQHMINVIHRFCCKWGLTVNLIKTKVMVFRNGGPLRRNEKWYFNNELLEVVNGYKYLGTLFTPKLSWSQSQKILAAQAQKGINMLRRYDYKCNILPVNIQFELFDKMIGPILLYGSEIWGFSVTDHIEKVQNSFCRYILGVSTHTPTLAVLAETGRYPMYVQYYKRCAKYWIKLLSMPDSRYPKACYKMLLSLEQAGRNTWASSVKQMLLKYGFNDVWEAQDVENPTSFLRELVTKIEETHDVEWGNLIAQSSKLSLYRELKVNGILRESYLYNVNLKPYRACLTKLRCSAHKLQIEKGRHSGQLMADRVCQLCTELRNVYVLEDEYHFTMCCPSYVNLRETHLQNLIEEIVGQNKYEIFLQLLSSNEETVQKEVATFTYQANKLRTTLLSELNEK